MEADTEIHSKTLGDVQESCGGRGGGGGREECRSQMGQEHHGKAHTNLGSKGLIETVSVLKRQLLVLVLTLCN